MAVVHEVRCIALGPPPYAPMIMQRPVAELIRFTYKTRGTEAKLPNRFNSLLPNEVAESRFGAGNSNEAYNLNEFFIRRDVILTKITVIRPTMT